MKVLALETSTTACSIAIQCDEAIFTRHIVAPMQQAKLILPIIDELLQESHLTLQSLDAIAYGAGPGSFTGIRIANSVAQGLAMAANKPVVPVSSLAILAQTALNLYGCRTMYVAVDARMQQIYWAKYTNNNNLVCLEGEERLYAPVAIPEESCDNWYGIGDGWSLYLDELSTKINTKPVQVLSELQPNANALLSLACDLMAKGKTVSAINATPVYLR
jgi:tRNA threonylcarbamoyladenosine biosynthesis protein TsaB